ncbi:MAG: oligopeptide transporter, OPT family [Saprospiraceae bacterium]|uniref:Oligopeptide transporter, OPT family n=1 Tax=Candidatus Opimibacter skivensis TaxID=2982028 RepID=A0A9D7XNN2_9BACT|nr:oligopeptide transporter, OPT family [Candidatus Opimibacter skivensis]
MSEENKPYIPAETVLPETTVKAFILGALLSVILAAANAYLGLFAGMTVSACIPAAVISMVVLKMFKNNNILENNIVQTAASAGEALAAGAIFTFPALIIFGYWTSFSYWETMLIALCGGVLGVLFTIPLRRALIVEQNLKFPEGVATAEVLKSGEEAGKSIRYLVTGALLGAVLKFSEAGLKLWSAVAETATTFGTKIYAYVGLNQSPALMAVGYIVGLRISFLIFLGGAISWWVAMPIYLYLTGIPQDDTLVAVGGNIWSSQIRYLGVGAMLVGGLWAIISLVKPIIAAVKNGLAAIRNKTGGANAIRTERDMPMGQVLIAIVAMIIPIFIIYLREIQNVPITLFMAVIMLIAGFIFSAVAGYMAGLVGSSNNPISGVTIATILTSSLILLALMGKDSTSGPVAAIMIGAVTCCAASIAGDNLQDLKAGYMLGATPRAQQIMLMVGVVAAAVALPVILNLLNTAYGLGAQSGRETALQAPQASLMASVAKGVFQGGLPWTMVYIGMAIGVVIIIIDQIQEARKSEYRVPVLAVAVGIYLPFDLGSAVLVGGLVSWAVTRFQNKNPSKAQPDVASAASRSERTGLLFASGLITGEALIGILLAVPIVIWERNVFDLHRALPGLVGLVCLLGVCYWVYKSATKSFMEK